MASLMLLKGQTTSQHTRDSPYGENLLHSSSMFLNPYSKRYARYLTLYRNGSHYIETGYRYCKSSYGRRAFLTAFSNFCAAISLGAPPGLLENASIAGLTFTTNLLTYILTFSDRFYF